MEKRVPDNITKPSGRDKKRRAQWRPVHSFYCTNVYVRFKSSKRYCNFSDVIPLSFDHHIACVLIYFVSDSPVCSPDVVCCTGTCCRGRLKRPWRLCSSHSYKTQRQSSAHRGNTATHTHTSARWPAKGQKRLKPPRYVKKTKLEKGQNRQSDKQKLPLVVRNLLLSTCDRGMS